MTAEIVTTFMDRRKAAIEQRNPDSAPAAITAPSPISAQDGLHKIEGDFLFKALTAALETKEGYMALEFPFHATLEDLPFSKPEVHKFKTRESFTTTHQGLEGSPSIILTGHFQRASFPEAYPNAPATLYNRKIDHLYRVTEDGFYELNGISMPLSKDHMVAVFSRQVMVIAPENTQRVIKRAMPGPSSQMNI